MKINPNLKKLNTIFYNNICIILLSFVILCSLTCMFYTNKSDVISRAYNTSNGQIMGPITVKNKPLIYQVEAYFSGSNTGIDFTLEVLNSNKETLYEVGKDLFHESGYDSEGAWSEASRKVVAHLSFYESGKYYLKFGPGNKDRLIEVTIKKPHGSYVPYFIMAFWLLLISLIAFIGNNFEWLKTFYSKLSDLAEDD